MITFTLAAGEAAAERRLLASVGGASLLGSGVFAADPSAAEQSERRGSRTD